MSYVIGVDLGGTKIEAALVQDDGHISETHRVKTGVEDGPEDILKNLNEVINMVKRKEILGIGIGIPGFVHENKIHSAPNIPGLTETLNKFLQENPNTIIENDANCFALAEHKFGAGRGTNNMIGVIWGTGVGSGIIIDGKLLHGQIGGAGQIGHMILDHNISEYRLGGPSTWEGLVSGPNIIKKYKKYGGTIETPRPDTIFDSDEEASNKVKQEVLQDMGMALGSLVNIFNPEVIILGGGVSNLDVYDELNKLMKKYSIGASSNVCRVVKHACGDSAGVLGAAALVFK